MEKIQEIILQLFLSIFLGGIIGIDRELKRKPGGLRTHILICLGSTFLMIISKHAAGNLGDPTRIAAQVISGIGFIGGGVIMKYGFNIKGITTASTIWVVTAIGLGIGLSMYWESILLTLFSLVVLLYVNRLEHRFFKGDESKILLIDLKTTTVDDEDIRNVLNHYQLMNKTLEIEKIIPKNKTRFKFLIYIPRNLELDHVIRELTKIKKVQKIAIEDPN
ncbi:MAG: MgtC/SapB family protein [Leptospiraceae bacterium]|jgi:putative Mg2+ transporter-C (MgtC) family protein|nr:MgtC/SapB family protein [Leptospiraceae bacterium]